MNFEDWKKECKRLIYNQTEGAADEVAEHNISCVDEWDNQFDMGYTPKEAVYEANMDVIEQNE